MNLEDLKGTWEKEVMVKENVMNFENVVSKVDEYDCRAKKLWAIEIIACAAVIIFVSIKWLFLSPPIEQLHPLFHLGTFAMIAGCVLVAMKIVRGRKVASIDNWTLAAKLDIQIEKREKEHKLLKEVAYWYLSPLFIAVILYSYGGYVQRTDSYIPDATSWIVWAICLALYTGIYFLNQRAAKTKIQPILDQLYALRKELKN